jgi:ribonuclease E
MLDSERNSQETDNNNEAAGQSAGAAPAPTGLNGPAEPPATSGPVLQNTAPSVPAALFQPPQVLFQPPAPVAPPVGDRDSGDRESGGRDSGGRDSGDRDSGGRDSGGRDSGGRDSGGRESGGRDSGNRDSGGRDSGDRDSGSKESGGRDSGSRVDSDGESGRPTRRTRGRGRTARVRDTAQDDELFSAESAGAVAEADEADRDTAAAASASGAEEAEESVGEARSRRRRRNTRGRGRAEATADDDADGQAAADDADDSAADGGAEGEGDADESGAAGRRRRRKRRRGSAENDMTSPDDPPDTVVHVREPHNIADDVRAIKGSTRLEAKKQRRREGRESGRRRPPVITESEFLARRESVERTMVVRQRGDRTQIAVLEDGVLVEHYVNRTTHASYVGNVYLGKVQNVLPSMEAAFVDIGKGRNAVLYAGEVNFDASGLEGQPKRIESALKPGQSVIVQVTKDPVGHKGARLTSQVSLPGRYLVYVPGASMTGISRKLPDTERTRLKQILKKVTPENAGVIVRTAAEGAAEAELDRDITRLAAQWETIEKKAKTASAPALLYGEPDLTIRVIRDVFNEDFNKLIVSGDEGWEIIDEYVRYVAPHLADRISRWDADDDPADDVFAAYRIDEQLAKALERKVWLPSGGSLVIDRTEAMTVIDVNTGKFTGQGGNLEETVTRNNLEAAEEIVRQLRLRDVGGIVVIDFIDMVLESNRELVLRRMLECLARDRTKHQVAEVTSLGLVQMTRKRVGAGLLEAFSQQCECCNGRGVIVTLDAPAEPAHRASAGTAHRPVPAPPNHAPGNGNGKGNGNGNAKGGYGNGRRGNGRRDDDRDAGRQDTPADVPADTGPADSPRSDADAAQAETLETGAVRSEAPGGANGAAGTEGEGGRRPRRSTSAGTAFATAVLVEDAPALVPVVPSAADQAPSAFTSVTTDPAPGEPADPSAPPVRRTRAGSAVARVTVVTEPEPAPEAAEAETAAPEAVAPETAAPEAAAPEQAVEEPPVTESAESAAETTAPPVDEFPATEVAAVTADAPAALTDEAEPALAAAWTAVQPATTEPAPGGQASAEWAAAEPVGAESVTSETGGAEPVPAESAGAEPDPEPEPEFPAGVGTEPAIVAASIFAPAEPATGEPTEPTPGEPTSAEPTPAEPTSAEPAEDEPQPSPVEAASAQSAEAEAGQPPSAQEAGSAGPEGI